ncbi:MAG: O-antigen ligase family protein [Chloroflexi bacterium]|nr:O-antigen ligase family protein [Chloroflexota bacterium]
MMLTRGMSSRIESGLIFTIWVGVSLILMTPLVVTQSTLFPYVVGKALYVRSLAELVFACWIVLAAINPVYRPSRSWVISLFGVYVLVSLIAALVGVSFQRSFWGDYRRMGGVFDLAHWFALAVVLVSILKGAKQWAWVLNANLGVSLVLALLGLGQQYDIRVFESAFWYLKPTERLDITFGNPTYVGAYMLVNVIVALGFLARLYLQRPQLPPGPQARRARGRRRVQRKLVPKPSLSARAFWAVTAALDFWVLVLSGTRGAALGLAVGLLVVGVGYVVWGSRKRVRVAAAVLTAGLLIVALAVPVLKDTALFQEFARSNVMASRFNRAIVLGGEDPSIRLRWNTARTGLVAFRQAPVLGWGPENFAVAFDRYADTLAFPVGTRLADQAHNKPVEELVTKGVAGFISYLLLLSSVVWVLARTVRGGSSEQVLALFLGAAVVGYLVQNLFLFDTPGMFLQFVLLVGWAATGERALASDPGRMESGSAGGASGAGRGAAARRASSRASNRGGLSARPWTEGTIVALMASVAVLLVASLYLLNYRPYRAAQIFPVESAGLAKFVAEAQRSFHAFPPLATLPRQVMFETLSEFWSRAGKNVEVSLLEQLKTEGEAALQSESRNPRLYLSVANLFQRAGESHPAYLPLARGYVESAQKLAPKLLETIKATINQEMAEGRPAEALAMLYEYRGSDPVKADLLKFEMNEAQGRLIKQIGDQEYLCRWAGKESLTREQRAQVQCKTKPTP